MEMRIKFSKSEIEKLIEREVENILGMQVEDYEVEVRGLGYYSSLEAEVVLTEKNKAGETSGVEN